MKHQRSADDTHDRPQPKPESVTDILDEPLHNDDLNTEIDRAGRKIGKLTAVLAITALVAFAFAAGIWVGSTTHSTPNPIVEQNHSLPATTGDSENWPAAGITKV
jgi:hypothetical protein